MIIKKKLWPLLVFVGIELVLYALILTTTGNALVCSEYISIIACFLFSLLYVSKGNWLIVCGLGFTVLADLCLVVLQPIQQLYGMVFFLLAQSCYAFLLHKQNRDRALLYIRLGLVVAVECVAVAVLREKTDPLAMVSMCYYVNLVMNLVMAFARFRENKLLALGFVLFLLCDTVIGLQTAAGAYLPIAEGSLLYRIIFMNFHLSWFFYLPSQVLIAIYGKKLLKRG